MLITLCPWSLGELTDKPAPPKRTYVQICDTTINSDIYSFSDIDECQASENECDRNADCSNTEGSYQCRCKDGFKGDGFNCTCKWTQTEIKVFLLLTPSHACWFFFHTDSMFCLSCDNIKVFTKQFINIPFAIWSCHVFRKVPSVFHYLLLLFTDCLFSFLGSTEYLPSLTLKQNAYPEISLQMMVPYTL